MFLNNSNAEEAEDCLRKRFWSKEYNSTGLQSVYKDDNLEFGTLVHLGLGAFYSGDSNFVDTTKRAAREHLKLDTLYFDDRNKWIDHIDWIGRILTAYEPWAKANDDFVPIQIETEGCVVLGEICYLCGDPYPCTDEPEKLLVCPSCEIEIHHWVFRIDMAVNKGEHAPKINIVDHKTTSSLGENYLLGWHNSLQLWGYCYGFAKQSGLEVGGYFVNILRKLKSIGELENPEKACPACKNGVRKRVGCLTCNGAGKVPREVKDDVPFVREYEPWNEYKSEIFVRQRVNIANRILQERKLFKDERTRDEAWPMNPKACFKMGRCPFWKLCYTPRDPEKWYEPEEEQLANFEPRPPDYVSIKQLAREEMV